MKFIRSGTASTFNKAAKEADLIRQVSCLRMNGPNLNCETGLKILTYINDEAGNIEDWNLHMSTGQTYEEVEQKGIDEIKKAIKSFAKLILNNKWLFQNVECLPSITIDTSENGKDVQYHLEVDFVTESGGSLTLLKSYTGSCSPSKVAEGEYSDLDEMFNNIEKE